MARILFFPLKLLLYQTKLFASLSRTLPQIVFHVDKIPCRLVTTYQGVATQWLNHSDVNRSKLGTGNLGKPDEESGLFKSLNNINQLKQGDVALLKGEYWDENEGAGLVHRSPAVAANEQRLLLTLDFI